MKTLKKVQQEHLGQHLGIIVRKLLIIKSLIIICHFHEPCWTGGFALADNVCLLQEKHLKSAIFICLLTIFPHDFSVAQYFKIANLLQGDIDICTERLFGWLHYWLIINFIVYPTFTMWQRTINKMQKNKCYSVSRWLSLFKYLSIKLHEVTNFAMMEYSCQLFCWQFFVHFSIDLKLHSSLQQDF